MSAFLSHDIVTNYLAYGPSNMNSSATSASGGLDARTGTLPFPPMLVLGSPPVVIQEDRRAESRFCPARCFSRSNDERGRAALTGGARESEDDERACAVTSLERQWRSVRTLGFALMSDAPSSVRHRACKGAHPSFSSLFCRPLPHLPFSSACDPRILTSATANDPTTMYDGINAHFPVFLRLPKLNGAALGRGEDLLGLRIPSPWAAG
ncbi:hypothetical protein B0H14DRAFT_3439609 [Mycena olivaceomarginata]|nr:hypothetical protein B0H14DRAFT_3439609 [Mycena olivaceomarginata]